VENKKIRVNSISAVGIVFKKTNPRHIFMEMKTPDYPRKVFASRGLIIGGNWVGPLAVNDLSTLDTLLREWSEEITPEKPLIHIEWMYLFKGEDVETYRIQPSAWVPSKEQRQELERLKQVVANGYEPFQDYIQLISEEVFKSKDPQYNKGSFQGLCSVWECGLSDDDWDSLVNLQALSGNLSNESVTLITSLDEIVETRWEIGWGEDSMLRDFFVSKGVGKDCDKFPLIPELIVMRVGMPLSSYEDYLKTYEVVNHA
jgi:hypothetical protein